VHERTPVSIRAYLDLLGLRLLYLGQDQPEDTLVHLCRDLLAVDQIGEGELSEKVLPIELLINGNFPLRLLAIYPTLDGERALAQINIHVLAIDSRHINEDGNLVLILKDVNGRHEDRDGTGRVVSAAPFLTSFFSFMVISLVSTSKTLGLSRQKISIISASYNKIMVSKTSLFLPTTNIFQSHYALQLFSICRSRIFRVLTTHVF